MVWFSLAAYLAVVIKRKVRRGTHFGQERRPHRFRPIPSSSVKFFPTEYILMEEFRKEMLDMLGRLEPVERGE